MFFVISFFRSSTIERWLDRTYELSVPFRTNTYHYKIEDGNKQRGVWEADVIKQHSWYRGADEGAQRERRRPHSRHQPVCFYRVGQTTRTEKSKQAVKSGLIIWSQPQHRFKDDRG